MSTNTHFSRNNIHDTSCLEFSGQIVSVKTHPSISSGHLLMPYAPVTNGQIPLTGWTYTHEARGQEDQLPGVEQKSGRPDPVALSSTEPALGQSTRERHHWRVPTAEPKYDRVLQRSPHPLSRLGMGYEMGMEWMGKGRKDKQEGRDGKGSGWTNPSIAKSCWRYSERCRPKISQHHCSRLSYQLLYGQLCVAKLRSHEQSITINHYVVFVDLQTQYILTVSIID